MAGRGPWGTSRVQNRLFSGDYIVGGDYHITRSSDWMVNQGREISKAEWQYYAHNDHELSSDPENGPNSFIWNGHPERTSEAWLDWSQGNVYSTEPDQPLLEKMVKIASRLEARLVSDRNEVQGPAEGGID